MKKNLINFLTVTLLSLGLFFKFGTSAFNTERRVYLPSDWNIVSVLSVSVPDSSLILNNNEVLVQYRFNDSLGLFEPGSQEVWYKQLKQLSGYGYFDTDSFLLEQTVLKHLSLENGHDSTTVFNEIIRSLQHEGSLLYILKDQFIVTRKEEANNWFNLIFWSGLLALGTILLLNNWYKTPPEKVESPDDFRAESPIYIEKEVIRNEYILPEALVLYTDKFIEKYGDLYERIEALPYDSEERDKAHVLKMMIEMAVHSHSFHKIGRQNRWETLNESPNARLLTGRLPDPGKLSTFSAHPEEMDRKFRFFVGIIKGLKINSLEVYLRDEVVVGPDDLK